ncbi:hypothetical protein [Mycetocola lacteus]|uniref:hypothetical protein n=1 Tax=Mycetocola lacteus TaxID=76637 RepID=UPI0011C45A4B|nr:hypothetical protein [Mycetocola lacteus]
MSSTSPNPRSRRSRDIVAILILLLLACGFVGAQVAQSRPISPVDEHVYVDALLKFPQHPVIQRGELINDQTRHLIDCHGMMFSRAPELERCAGTQTAPLESYPRGSFSGVDIYTPIYVAVTWIASRPFVLAGLDTLSALRMAGAAWLAAAAILLYFTTRRLGLDRMRGVAVGALLIGSVPAWWSATFVSTDAALLTVGAGLVLAAIAWWQRAVPSWLLCVLGLLAVWIKFQAVFIVGALAVALIWSAGAEWLRRRGMTRRMGVHARIGSHTRLLGDGFTEPTPRRYLWTAAGMAGAVLVAQGSWLLIRALVPAAGPTPVSTGDVPTTGALLSESGRFVWDLMAGSVPMENMNPVSQVLACTGSLLLVVAALVQLIIPARRPLRALAIGFWVAILTLGPLIALSNILVEGYYFALPSRYAMALVPLGLVFVAAILPRSRFFGAILLLGGATAAALSLGIGQ